MTNRFDDLLVLQEHDAALDRLRHRHDTLPERATVADTEATLTTMEAALELVRTDRDGIDRREKALDDEASSLKTKADEVERKMYSGEMSSPKELQAMQAEVEQLRSHQSDLETTELELMEQREPVDRKFAQLTARVAEHRAQLESAPRGAGHRRGRGEGRGAGRARRSPGDRGAHRRRVARRVRALPVAHARHGRGPAGRQHVPGVPPRRSRPPRWTASATRPRARSSTATTAAASSWPPNPSTPIRSAPIRASPRPGRVPVPDAS